MMSKCSDYDDKNNKCRNGFLRIHPVCWGGIAGCSYCKHITSVPDCLNEDLPEHLQPKEDK